MKTYILLLTCLMATSFGHAMNPIAANPMNQKENGDFFADCENILDVDLNDYPALSPIKPLTSPREMVIPHQETHDEFALDLNALGASPQPSPSKPERTPLAPLAHSILAKRVLFPEDSRENTASRTIDTHTENPAHKIAKTLTRVSLEKQNHNCHLCDKKFSHKTDLTHHLSSHFGIKPYKCTQCDKSFVQKSQRKTHVERVHLGIQIPDEDVAILYEPHSWPVEKYPYQCSFCNKGFRNPNSLFLHQRAMENNTAHQQFKSDTDQSTPPAAASMSNEKSRAASEKSTHVPEVPAVHADQHMADECEQETLIVSFLADDTRNPDQAAHDALALLPLLDTDLSDPKEAEKTTTVVSAEKLVSALPGLQADSLTAEPSTLGIKEADTHKVSATKKEKIHICQQCGKTFKRKTNLDDHMNLHKGITPFACPYCPKSYTQKSNRNTHIKTSHKGQALPGNEELVIYEPSFWPKDKYPYQCSVCYKGFESFVGLDLHKRMMEGNQTHLHIEAQKKHEGSQGATQDATPTLDMGPHMQTHVDTYTPQKTEIQKATAHSTNVTKAPESAKAVTQDQDLIALILSEDVQPVSPDYQEPTAIPTATQQRTPVQPQEEPKKTTQSKSDCPECGEYLHRIDLLLCHILSKHARYEPYRCDIISCGFSTAYPNNLKRHAKDMHNQNPTINLSLAEQTKIAQTLRPFLEKKNWKAECPLCNLLFPSETHMKRHKNAHGINK